MNGHDEFEIIATLPDDLQEYREVRKFLEEEKSEVATVEALNARVTVIEVAG